MRGSLCSYCLWSGGLWQFFLFVIPSVILFYRCLLAIPCLVFEGVSGEQALENRKYWHKGQSRLVLRLIGQHLFVLIGYLLVVGLGVTGFCDPGLSLLRCCCRKVLENCSELSYLRQWVPCSDSSRSTPLLNYKDLCEKE